MFAVEFRRRGNVVAALTVAALLAAPHFIASGMAQDAAATPPAAAAPADDTVVATVGDHKITEADIRLATESFAEELANVPPAQVRGAVIDAVIDLYLVSEAATAAALDEDAAFKRRMSFLRQRVLRAEYFNQQVSPTITEEKVRARYDEELKGIDFPDEVQASHILVETEDEAKQIIAEIKGGGDFAAIAKEKSKDPGSGQNGGDLGFFTAETMVEPFSKAAFALEVGGMTDEPVQSQFGWHVIKVIDRRKQEPPKFEDVRPQITSAMLREAAVAELQRLRKAVKIDIVGAPAEPAAEAAPGAGEAPKPAQ